MKLYKIDYIFIFRVERERITGEMTTDLYNKDEFRIEGGRITVLEKDKGNDDKNITSSGKLKIYSNPYWIYISSLYSRDLETPLFKELSPLCHTYGGKMYGKDFTASRMSCLFSDMEEMMRSNSDETFSYQTLDRYHWTKSPTLLQIKETAEEITGEKFNLCLVHLYKDGKSNIGYHNDKEALSSCVFSVSFGENRRFRFRKINDTKGFDYELKLKSGDVVWMLAPDPSKNRLSCQHIYKHSVPVESAIKNPRINLTFRQI